MASFPRRWRSAFRANVAWGAISVVLRAAGFHRIHGGASVPNQALAAAPDADQESPAPSVRWRAVIKRRVGKS